MPALVTITSLEDDRQFRFQFAPVGASTAFSSVVVETPVRGGPALADYSHSNAQTWRIPGEFIAEDWTDDPEERLESLVGPMWRPVPGTSRKPRVLLTGIGRRSYPGIVVSVENVRFVRIGEGGRPRRVTFDLVYRCDDDPAQTAGVPSVRQIGRA